MHQRMAPNRREKEPNAPRDHEMPSMWRRRIKQTLDPVQTSPKRLQ